MGRDKIRHLVSKPNRDGSRRFYWQPTAKLIAAGYAVERLPDDHGQAVARAVALNATLDGWYRAGRPRLDSALPDVAPDGTRPKGSVWQLIQIYKAGPPEDPAITAAGAAAAEAPEGDEDNDGDGYGYDYNSLRDNTRRSYDGALAYIAEWLGPVPVRKVSRTMILERLKAVRRQRHASGPHKGRRKVATSLLIARIGRMLFAASRFLVPEEHPCCLPEGANPWAQLRSRDRRRKGKLWTREARDALCAAAADLGLHSIAAAIKINWWLGQREADILALPATLAMDGRVHEIVQGKTAGSVHLPMGMVPEIVATVADLRARQEEAKLSGIRLLIDERNGLTWNEDRFRKAFRDVRARAIELALDAGNEGLANEVEELTFMRLRHTAVTMNFRAGCTVPEVASITGHTIDSVDQIIERYGMRDAVTAGNAFQKRLNREGE